MNWVMALQVFLTLWHTMPCAAHKSRPRAFCDGFERVIVHYRKYYEIYLTQNETTGQMYGMFAEYLADASKTCCPAVVLEYRELVDHDESTELVVLTSVERVGENRKQFHFYFPEFAERKDKTVYTFDMPFLKLRYSPGQAVVMVKPEPKQRMRLYEIFYASYPLFLLMITLAWAVGILGWVLDHWKNSEQFPNPFVLGMFQGFWWSIVTMTTVGYGDKTPKSAPARLLAIIWVMTSAILLSLFTANTTTMLHDSMKEEDHSSTIGRTFGVLQSKHFIDDMLNLGSEIKNYQDIAQLVASLESGEIDRLLFPHYKDLLRLFKQNEDLRDRYQIANVLDSAFQIGMVLSRKRESLTHNDTLFLNCLGTMISQYERQMNDTGIFSKSAHSVQEQGELMDESPLSQTKLIGYVYFMLKIIAGLVALGLLWDIYHYVSNKRRQEKPALPCDQTMDEKQAAAAAAIVVRARQNETIF